MKKSIAITTIVSIHAAVIGILLIQAGCSSDKDAAESQAPTAETSEQVTTISADNNTVAEPAVKMPEGSPDLRVAPTKPTYSLEDTKQMEPVPAIPDALNDGGAIEPMKIEPKKPSKQNEFAGETKIYTVQKGDSLSKIAHKYGVSAAVIAKLNSIKNSNSIRVGQKLKIPASAQEKAVAEAASAEGVSAGEDMSVYVVQKGDSLSKIAFKNGMSVAQLMQINSLKNANIRVGQKLNVRKTDSASAKTEAPRAQKAAAKDGEIVHVVKSGEVLGSIAHKYGVKIADIKKRNNISDPRKIRVGQKLVIPAGKSAAKAEAKPAAVAAKPEAKAPAAAEAKPAEQPKQEVKAEAAPVIVPEKPAPEAAAAAPAPKKDEDTTEVIVIQ